MKRKKSRHSMLTIGLWGLNLGLHSVDLFFKALDSHEFLRDIFRERRR